MDNFPSSPPAAVRADLAALRASLDLAGIPPKWLDRNVLVATWNIRGFGKVLDKWASVEGDSPRRNLRDVLCLAAIISRFDVVALQEVKRNLGGLRRVMEALGPNWARILTDITRGPAGNQERMAFVFDLRRVQPSGLAAELVVPIVAETSLTEVTMEKQFARTPYAVSFESQGTTFTLVTLHVLWGDSAGHRVPEIREIARWLRDWADGGDEFGENHPRGAGLLSELGLGVELIESNRHEAVAPRAPPLRRKPDRDVDLDATGMSTPTANALETICEPVRPPESKSDGRLVRKPASNEDLLFSNTPVGALPAVEAALAMRSW